MDETNEQQIDYEQLQELTEEEFYEVRKLEFQRSIQLMQELSEQCKSKGETGAIMKEMKSHNKKMALIGREMKRRIKNLKAQKRTIT
jgi:hypothetical protein